MTLDDVAIGTPVAVDHIGGDRGFRRRMMELGVLPGTIVELIRVAPLGDPIEMRARGCCLSIRRREARSIAVRAVAATSSFGCIEPSLSRAETAESGIAHGAVTIETRTPAPGAS